jgi:hypothetical protein
MNPFAKTFSLSACALAASLLISACGGGSATDNVAPTATITAAASSVPGNVTFTFAFSESVGSSFSVEDLLVTNGTPINFTKVDATTYTVSVTPTSAGAVTVNLAAGKVFDLANNPNAVAATKTFDPNAVAIIGNGNTANCTTTSTVNCFGFEDTSVLFEAFEGLASAGTVIDPAGGTNKVVELVKVPLVNNVGSQPWAGVTLHTSAGTGNASKPFTSPTIDFATSKIITLRVLSPAVGKQITLKVENSVDAAVNMLKTVNTTKANEWETLTFDFAAPTQSSGVANSFVANATFNVISLFPDFMTAETTSVSYYFDELTYATVASSGSGGTTGASACSGVCPTTAAPNPTAASTDVLSIYSDAYTPITGVNLNPNWGQSTVVSEVTVAGNKTEKYLSLNYQGIDFASNPINVCGMDKLHIDVWSPDIATLKLSIIGAGEQAKPLTLTAGQWNSFDTDLSFYTAPNKAAIDQIKFDIQPASPGTLYFDNLYFWRAAGSTGTAACGSTGVTGSTFTGGIYASDYAGNMALGTQHSTLGGNVGFFFDPRLFSTKVYDAGAVSGSAADPAGVHNFYYGFGKAATPQYTDAYFGGFVNAPGNTTADASAFTNIKLKFWGDAETWEKSNFTPAVEVVLQGPIDAACTNGSGRPEITSTVTGQKIGAGADYNIPKANFTLKSSCGGAYTINSVWSAIGVVAVQLNGTNLQYVNSVPVTGGVAYPTFINIGPISFN